MDKEQYRQLGELVGFNYFEARHSDLKGTNAERSLVAGVNDDYSLLIILGTWRTGICTLLRLPIRHLRMRRGGNAGNNVLKGNAVQITHYNLIETLINGKGETVARIFTEIGDVIHTAYRH